MGHFVFRSKHFEGETFLPRGGNTCFDEHVIFIQGRNNLVRLVRLVKGLTILLRLKSVESMYI